MFKVQLMPLSILKAEVKNEQMDPALNTSEIVNTTNTIAKREMKTEPIDDISQSSVTTIPHHVQSLGLKRETTDLCQSSYMKPETLYQAKEVGIKPEDMDGACSPTSPYCPIKEDNIKNEHMR